MAQPSTPFDELPPARHGHAEKVEDAVVETLLGDGELSSWFAGGITRTPVAEALPEVAQLPACFVSSQTVGQTFQFARETEQEIQVLVMLLFEEPRPRLEAGARSIRTVVEWIHDVLAANEALEVTLYNDVPLVDRLDRFAVVDYGQALGRGPEEDEVFEIGRYVTIGVTYQYCLSMDGYVRP